MCRPIVFAALTLIAGVLFAEDAYIESTSSQALNTGWCPGPATRIELDYALNDLTQQKRLFGVAGNDSTKFNYATYINSNGDLTFACGDEWKTVVLMKADTARHTIIADSEKNTVEVLTDGKVAVSGAITSARTKTSSFMMALCGAMDNAAGTSVGTSACAMKIYGCKIYEAGELVRDFRPARVSGTVGLYDRLTDTFIRQTSGDPLTAGGDIEEITYRTPYVQLAANTALNSRFFVSPDAKVEFDYAFYTLDGVSQARLFGTAGDTVACEVYVGGAGPSCFAGDGAGAGTYSGKAADLDRHTVVVDAATRNFTYKTGFTTEFSGSFAAVTRTGTFPMAIGARMTNANGMSYGQYAKIRVYGMRCYKGGALVHDYRPVVQDGAIGLRDAVDGEFLTTGSLTSGGEIPAVTGPAFIESTYQDAYLDTGTYFGPQTRLELDYAFLSTVVSPTQQFVMNASDSLLTARFYSNSETKITMGCYMNSEGGGFVNTGVPIRLYERHVSVIDVPERTISISTSGYTNFTGTTKGLTATCANPTTVFAAGNSCYSKVRIYGLKIYENGALVRSYVPQVKDGVAGLYDTVTKTFTIDNDKRNTFNAGGAIEVTGATDAYLESDGTHLVNTGYYVNKDSRVECDFQLVYAGKTGDWQQRLFGNDAFDNNYAVYISGSGDAYFAHGDTRKTYGPLATDVCRHTAIIDNYAGQLRFKTGDAAQAWAMDAHERTATVPFPVFARYANAAATAGGQFTKMRLYSLRIYEKDVLVHEFLPMLKDGVAGLCDTVSGKFVTASIGNAATLRMSGAGFDGSGAAKGVKVAPQATSVRFGKPNATLSVYAPGAIEYRWTKNGEVIAGATGDTLDVVWQKKKADDLDDTYTVTAIYVVNGTRVESDPYVTTVTNQLTPFVLLVR